MESNLSVIIQVINKIGRPRSSSPICLITGMITDRIGRHEALLTINHNYHNYNKTALNSVESRLLGDKFDCQLVLLCYFFVWNTRRVLYVIM